MNIWREIILKQKNKLLRTATCNRCSNVFGVESRLGISEVAGCYECLEYKNTTSKRYAMRNINIEAIEARGNKLTNVAMYLTEKRNGITDQINKGAM